MSSITNTFTPGRRLSEFFYTKDNIFAHLRPEKREEFIEYAGQRTMEAQRADMAAAKQGAGKSIELTKDQMDYLVDTYNPRKMSKAEYSAFIHDMLDMGVITEDDTRFLVDVDGYYAFVSLFEPGGSVPLRRLDSSAVPSYSPGCQIPHSYKDSKGDILTWYSFEAAWRSCDATSHTYYRARTERTYGKVYSVLEQMAQMRPDSEEAVQEKQKSVQRDYQASRLAWDLKNR